MTSRLRTGLAALAVAAAAALGLTSPAGAGQPQPPLPTVRLEAGIYVIRAEVAADPVAREKGLMFRESLDANDGMLFVFPAKDVVCFWMRNTLIPLSIAFIGDDGRVVNIADMKPRTDDTHCPARPIRYALEMNRGWFASRGIGPGFRLSGPAGMFAPR